MEKIENKFEDLLTSINENTSEIQSNYTMICEQDHKIHNLMEGVISVLKEFKETGKINENLLLKWSRRNTSSIKLSKREEEIFLILYTLDGKKGEVTYLDIAKRINFPEDIVASYISNMLQKGIPIIKKYTNNEAHLSLDPKFKSLQAKENILDIKSKKIFKEIFKHTN